MRKMKTVLASSAKVLIVMITTIYILSSRADMLIHEHGWNCRFQLEI